MNKFQRKKYICIFTLAALLAGSASCAYTDPGTVDPVLTEDLPPAESVQIEPEQLLGIQGNTPIVRAAPEIPDTCYIVTASPREKTSLESRRLDAQALGPVFNCTPLIGEGKYYEEVDRLQFDTEEGGLLECNGSSILFAAQDTIPCSVLEIQGAVKRVAVLDLNAGADMSWSYPIGGEYYSVADAVRYVEEFWSTNLRPYTSGTDHVQVGTVIVYQDQNGSCKYVMLMDKYLYGLPVEQYSALTHFKTQGFRESFILAELDAPDHICFYQDNLPFRVLAVEETDDLMTAEEAVERTNEVLANYARYSVQEQTLKYGFFINEEATSASYEGEFTARPYWCMVLEKGAGGGYVPDNYCPNVTLFVDAVTGTAYLVDTMYGEQIQIAQ